MAFPHMAFATVMQNLYLFIYVLEICAKLLVVLKNIFAKLQKCIYTYSLLKFLAEMKTRGVIHQLLFLFTEIGANYCLIKTCTILCYGLKTFLPSA